MRYSSTKLYRKHRFRTKLEVDARQAGQRMPAPERRTHARTDAQRENIMLPRLLYDRQYCLHSDTYIAGE